MRTKAILIGALLVASAGLAQAQDTTQAAAQTPSASTTQTFTPKFGTIDFGYRGSDITGDAARAQRLQDLRDGAYVNRFRFDKETETVAFSAAADNVGYRNQQYRASAEAIGKVKASFDWTSNPLYQADAIGLHLGAGTANQTIPVDIRQAIQSGTLTAANAFAANAKPYTIESRRDVANVGLVYAASRDVDVKLDVRNTLRSGSNLMSFGFGNSPGNMLPNDMAVPVNDRTTDVKTKVEYASRQGVIAVGYDASWYNQNDPIFTFDNPLRATDTTTGPAFGRTSLWPSNNTNSMNVSGSIKLPAHSKASAFLSYGVWNQNESLLPNTTNSALVGVAALERSTAEAKANVTSMVYTFTSRPAEQLWFNAKFRYYDYNNKTPEFTTTFVPGDYSIGSLATTEPASFGRKTFDVDASYSPFHYFEVNGGYTRENANRSFRAFPDTYENIGRVSIDSVGNQYVTARLKYEYSQRRGAFEVAELPDSEQSQMYQFDLAPRDRQTVTAVLTVTPVSVFDVNATVSTGRDKYPDTYFGVQKNDTDGYSIGFDVIPVPTVNFGVNYGYEKYTNFQWSRTSNPLSATDQGFNDPRRDWGLNTADKVNTVSANLDFIKALPKTDIRLSYDLSDGNTDYTYSVPANSIIAAPVQYTKQPYNKITVAKADVQYFVRANVALGVAYWFEQYRVQDFAFDPALLSNGYLTTGFYSGYAYEPYKANTVFVRMRYLW